MADRDVRLITKRTSVVGKIPTGTTGNELNLIKQGELASNLADKKLYSYDGSNVFEFGSNSFLGLTGGTITGNTIINGNFTVTGNTSLKSLSATTFISGSTNLYDIFLTSGQLSGTSVSAGSNISVAVNGNDYKVSVSASPIFNGITFSGTATGNALSATTLSGGTILSGSTNLYSIFQPQSGVLKQKNGSVTGSTFAGNPKTATVTFATAFADNNYAVTVTGEVNRTWSVESKTAAGFTINANANLAFNSSNVFWMAAQIGESN